MLRNKWLATTASIWIQCTSGSAYTFAIYSPLLKSTQHYDQSTLDTVAFFKDVGANFGLLAGLLYSAATPSSSSSSSSSSTTTTTTINGGCRRGPWLLLLAGALQCFAGYFLMWLSVTGALPRPPLILMCLYMFLASHSQTFFSTADVVSAVENFPDSRGTAVGIMKGYLGISAAILIQVYRTTSNGKSSSFLLMLALLPSFMPLLLMYFVKVDPKRGQDDKRHLDIFSVVALIVAGYLMVIIIWENVQTLGSSVRIITFVILLLLLVSPLSIAIRAQLMDSRTELQTPSLEGILLTNDVDSLEAMDHRRYERVSVDDVYTEHDHIAYEKMPGGTGQESSFNQDKRIILRGENMNLLQAVCTVDFWLLFVAMACGMGSGLATVNNISQIGGSLGYTSVEISCLVSLWSIWNFLGRFGAGYVSDYLLHLHGYARPLFMAITLATMCIGHAVISSGLPGALYAGSILVGICYGCQWSLMPTITSEIFGIRHMGTLFNTISIASPVGSYILSVRVVGFIYDMEASSDDGKTCAGVVCGGDSDGDGGVWNGAGHVSFLRWLALVWLLQFGWRKLCEKRNSSRDAGMVEMVMVDHLRHRSTRCLR